MIKFVTIQVPEGSYILPPGEMERRIKAAEDHMYSAEMLSAEGPVYSESGYYQTTVEQIIDIMAGIDWINKPQPPYLETK